MHGLLEGLGSFVYGAIEYIMPGYIMNNMMALSGPSAFCVTRMFNGFMMPCGLRLAYLVYRAHVYGEYEELRSFARFMMLADLGFTLACFLAMPELGLTMLNAAIPDLIVLASKFVLFEWDCARQWYEAKPKLRQDFGTFSSS